MKKLNIIIGVSLGAIILIGGYFIVYRLITNDNGLKPMVGAGEQQAKPKLAKFQLVDKVDVGGVTLKEVTEKQYNDKKKAVIAEAKNYKTNLVRNPETKIEAETVMEILAMSNQQNCLGYVMTSTVNLGVEVFYNMVDKLENNRCNLTSSSTQPITKVDKIIK